MAGELRRQSAAISPPAISQAVALMTAENAATGDTQAEILGDAPREPVIAALVLVANTFTRAILGDQGRGGRMSAEELLAVALQQLGLAMASIGEGCDRRTDDHGNP
jgi:hypothetical protein